MDYKQVAQEVLLHIGGTGNVDHAMTCLTRLRIAVNNMDLVEFEELRRQQGVLGVVTRNQDEVEVVFGPAAIEGIAHEFSQQSGITLENYGGGFCTPLVQAASEPEHDASSVHEKAKAASAHTISAGKRQSYRAQQRAALESGTMIEEDISALQAFLVSNGDKPANKGKAGQSRAVLVLNGPNINMLGIREPALYGREDYNALVRTCKAAAAEAGFDDIRCFQSNHEGALVDEIQNALGVFDGIVINPGAYTHTSVALLDAVKAVSLPCVEVHISKVEEREEFRQISYIRAACFETITGQGIAGYRQAILDLARKLGMGAL